VRDRRRRFIRAGLEHEEFGFHARVHREAEFGRASDQFLENSARVASEGFSVGGVDVADQPRDAALLITPGEDLEGAEVRREQHVGLLDPNESLDRGAVEHEIACQCLLELRSWNLDVLVYAEDVRELQSEKADVVGRGEVEDVLGSCA